MRGLGYIRDIDDARDRLIAAHPRIAGSSLLSTVDLRPWAPPIDDQKGTSACVGFTLAAGFDIRARLQGLDVPRLSPRAIYTLARSGDSILVDQGCRPRDAMMGLRSWGVMSIDRVPFSEETIDEPLPWDAYQHGHDARACEFWRIPSYGEERVEDVMRALSAGFPVALAQPVDLSFDSLTAGRVLGPVAGQDRGGHFTLAIGYRTDGVFIMRNSWGRNWCDGGYYLMSPERLASVWITDVWVLEACSPGVS